MNWWSLYTPKGERVALVKHAEDAAALVAVLGNGYTIRSGRSVVLWVEGEEEISAADSYDVVADTVMRRFYSRTPAVSA